MVFGAAAWGVCLCVVFFGYMVSLVCLVTQVRWEWQYCELAGAGVGLQVGSRA